MDNKIDPLPVWKEKQNLTSDLVDIIEPRVSVWVRDNHSGMLRAVLKEVIQAGYRKQPEEPIANAMDVLTEAMQDVELGSLAHAWHCNIAMAVYDSCLYSVGHDNAYDIGNEAATRFMKQAFGVATTNERPKPKKDK